MFGREDAKVGTKTLRIFSVKIGLCDLKILRDIMPKNARRMSKNAINSRFDQKWVLICNPVYDDDELVIADVVAFSKDRGHVLKKIPRKSLIDYHVMFAQKPKRDPSNFLLPSVWIMRE